jgi:hypothetical protein
MLSLLTEWSRFGCPTKTGRDWTVKEMQAAIDRGPHQLALQPEALQHFDEEIWIKVAKGQAHMVSWDKIKHDPLSHLKVAPVAAIPHK